MTRIARLTRDKPYPIDPADRVRARLPAKAISVWTGEIRRPKAGEWYLKASDAQLEGKIVVAYCAAADQTAEHAIAELRQVDVVSLQGWSVGDHHSSRTAGIGAGQPLGPVRADGIGCSVADRLGDFPK